MSFTVQMGNSAPANTEAVFGMTEDSKSFMLNLDTATPEQQKICVNFFELVGGHLTVDIINSEHNFIDCTYIVVSGVDNQVVDIDYSAQTKTNKGKINAFANLLISLAQ